VLKVETPIILTSYNLKSFTAIIWGLLDQVQSLALSAFTKDRGSFFHNAAAVGRVEVSRTGSRVITFHETGLWTSPDRQTIDFRNIYQWRLSDRDDTIRLTHLRYGTDNPVHLVDFTPLRPDTLQSVQPHICGSDQYSAELGTDGGGILLSWRIRGPSKNDVLNCRYSTEKKTPGHTYEN